MKDLIKRFSGLVKGTISGCDRIVLKGLMLPMISAGEVMLFCRAKGASKRNITMERADKKGYCNCWAFTHCAPFMRTIAEGVFV